MVVDRPSRHIFAGNGLHQFRGLLGYAMVRHEFRLLFNNPIPGFNRSGKWQGTLLHGLSLGQPLRSHRGD